MSTIFKKLVNVTKKTSMVYDITVEKNNDFIYDGTVLHNCDYQNQLYVSAWNRGQQDVITINPLDKIAQCIFVPIIHPQFTQVDVFTEETVRGLGGFGSTGVAVP